MKSSTLLTLALFVAVSHCLSQTNIHTKEGRPILRYRELIDNCVRSFNKDKTDKTVLAICKCQVEKLDYHFTNKQYKKYTIKGSIDINGLLKEDSVFEKEFLENCVQNLKLSTEKSLDADRLSRFCSCQLELVRQRKLSDLELEALSDPNSVLFYEMMYRCGSPFQEADKKDQNWSQQFINDINGPATDTINIMTLNGMTYIKIKIGTLTQMWLLDTGASDLLINKDMETALKSQNIMSEKNYLGTGEYEMANGVIDTCRRYKIDDVQIGNYHVSNVIVAVTDKGKRNIAGKILLNKFSEWNLSNRKNLLVLNR